MTTTALRKIPTYAAPLLTILHSFATSVKSTFLYQLLWVHSLLLCCLALPLLEYRMHEMRNLNCSSLLKRGI